MAPESSRELKGLPWPQSPAATCALTNISHRPKFCGHQEGWESWKIGQVGSQASLPRMDVVSCFSPLRLLPFPEEEVNCLYSGAVSEHAPLHPGPPWTLMGSSQLAKTMETDGDETEAVPN